MIAALFAVGLGIALVVAYLLTGLLVAQAANLEAAQAVKSFKTHGKEYDDFAKGENAVLSRLSGSDPGAWQTALQTEQAELAKMAATDQADRRRLNSAEAHLKAAESPLTVPQRSSLERSRADVEAALGVLADTDTVISIYRKQFSVLSAMVGGVATYSQAVDRLKAGDTSASLAQLDQAGAELDAAINQARLDVHLSRPVLTELADVRELVTNTRALVVAAQNHDAGGLSAARSRLDADLGYLEADSKQGVSDPLYAEDDYVKYLISDMDKRLKQLK